MARATRLRGRRRRRRGRAQVRSPGERSRSRGLVRPRGKVRSVRVPERELSPDAHAGHAEFRGPDPRDLPVVPPADGGVSRRLREREHSASRRRRQKTRVCWKPRKNLGDRGRASSISFFDFPGKHLSRPRYWLRWLAGPLGHRAAPRCAGLHRSAERSPSAGA